MVVMPNHIHGILVVYGNPVGTRHAVSLHEQFGKPTRGTNVLQWAGGHAHELPENITVVKEPSATYGMKRT